MALLSVLLPTYNGARFLEAQIDSILAQTASDIELLLIDDGSSDDTVAILDHAAGADRRVKRLPSVGNRDHNRRLVELLGAASGEFVAIADQDDVWEADRNARLLAAIGDRVLACGRSQLIDAGGSDLGLSILEAKGVEAAQVGPLGALFLPLVSAHAAIIRRSWIDLAAFFGAMPFDMALGLEALFSGGLIYVDGAVVRHRIHGGNRMNGGVVPVVDKFRWFSPYRVVESLGHVRSRRIAFYLLLAQLGRSGALAPPVRAMFEHLAGTAWNVWFGIGGRPRSLKREFYRCLASYAASSEDLALFTDRVHSLTQPGYAPINLAASWRHYRGPNRSG